MFKRVVRKKLEFYVNDHGKPQTIRLDKRIIRDTRKVQWGTTGYKRPKWGHKGM